MSSIRCCSKAAAKPSYISRPDLPAGVLGVEQGPLSEVLTGVPKSWCSVVKVCSLCGVAFCGTLPHASWWLVEVDTVSGTEDGVRGAYPPSARVSRRASVSSALVPRAALTSADGILGPTLAGGGIFTTGLCTD